MNHPRKQFCLLSAWLLTLFALLVTLYSSEFLNFPVCHLCWYQRICLYPLTVVLGIACFRDDLEIAIYTIPMAMLGGVFALYQYLEQMIPGFAPINLCTKGPDCSQIHLQLFGFVTFPLLSLLACMLLTTLLFCSYQRRQPAQQ